MGAILSKSPSQGAILPDESDQPPEYNSIDNAITALTVPNWTWSHAQCVEWLTLIFMHHFSLTKIKARRIANVFEGSGPNLWRTTTIEWGCWLGTKSGRAMFEFMRDMYRTRGIREQAMMPNHIKLMQYRLYIFGGEPPQLINWEYLDKLVEGGLYLPSYGSHSMDRR